MIFFFFWTGMLIFALSIHYCVQIPLLIFMFYQNDWTDLLNPPFLAKTEMKDKKHPKTDPQQQKVASNVFIAWSVLNYVFPS